ncbi:hypothetical protein [Pseudochryseolinea flava]|uniref:Uncharacterized protein n=1 Tax=Pseudochryseolinea flava TaxID=2059302 RepID=A0A364Y0T6_9BACT|nr:hypothetical protein [Pseudochryseolinea flava]RAW00285.1 hypothetical protein DQQ10_14610 [Pseudochryseolinea flava]
MISTIFIDTDTERMFPISGNTREAVAEFVKSQIDLSFVVLCSQEKIKMLKPDLNEEQVELILSRLLTLPSLRRNDLGPYQICVDEIYQNLLSKKDFVVTGWAALFNAEKLTYLYNHKKVIHSFEDTLEHEFLNVYNSFTTLLSGDSMRHDAIAER